ncbi:MAG TPA: protein kinase [Steroidobacteraceae bacterium]|nr:protein kinase [Steroidobacteraceae bacterium]
MSEVWTKWQNQIINGTFPLRRFLGASDHSAVFLTEHKARGLADAAIKLVPAHPAHSDAHLARWKTAAALSHAHLLRAFDSGRCQLGGHPFLFLVMEYAEENLSQVLPRRPLTTDEVRGLLQPTLEALAYLHGQGLAHGQVKPPNILVVGDQVKLASDNIRPLGHHSAAKQGKGTPYDPPEARSGTVSAAGDVWGLGVTMTEALTQSLPSWPEGSENVSLPLTLNSKFVEWVRRCLSRDPSTRPTVAGLLARILVRQPDAPAEAAAAASASDKAPGRPAAPMPSPSAAPGIAAPSVAKATTPAEGPRSSVTSPAAAPSPRITDAPTAAANLPRTAGASIPAAAAALPDTPRTAPAPPAAVSPAKVSQPAGRTGPPERPAGPAAHAPASSIPPSAAREPSAQRESMNASPPITPDDSPRRSSYLPRVLAIVVVFAVVWGALRFFARPATNATRAPATTSQADSQIATAPASPGDDARSASAPTAPPSSETAASSAPAAQPAAGATSPAVLHEEVPNIPLSARSTIRGHIKISVRVTTDRAGNVVDEVLETPGPSHYFAKLVSSAARNWKFAPLQGRDSQQWLLWFELTRDGATAQATPR